MLILINRFFSNLLKHYELDNPESYIFQCTYKLTGLNLELACQSYDIDTADHHNAEKDALMCAKLYLKVSEKDPDKFIFGDYYPESPQKSKRDFDKKTLRKLEDSEISDKSNPFYNQKIVITGVFLKYPDRSELAQKLLSLGADVVKSISNKTTMVIVGADAGPSKLKKIEDLNAKGANIRIIREKELVDLLESTNNVNTEENNVNIFKNKNVLINGFFNAFDSNKDLNKILYKMGVNRIYYNEYDNIDIVLIGKKPREEAVEAMNKYIVEGRYFKCITEDELLKIIIENFPNLVNIKII